MKRIKKFLAMTMTFIMTSILLCGCEDGFLWFRKAQGTKDETVEEIKPINVVSPGGSYGFMESMAFMESDLMPTAETATYEPVSVTLTATVEPANANQSVTWSVEFMNATSTWASGKTVTDYVTVTTEEVGSTTATVTCKQPFGERIKVICTSDDNLKVSASCTVDFLPLIDVSLVFGEDIPVNFGGTTDVVWEINENGTGKGGAANVRIESGDVYTILPTYTWSLYLTSPEFYYRGSMTGYWGEYTEIKRNLVTYYNPAYSDGYFVLNGKDFGPLSVNGATELVLDYSFISKISLAYLRESTLDKDVMLLKNQTIATIEHYLSNIQEGSLYSIDLRVSANYGETLLKYYRYISLLNVTGYTNESDVESITLEKSEVTF